MNNRLVGLYSAGGITGFLSGSLMLISSYLVLFHLTTTYAGTLGEQLEFVANYPLAGAVHGLYVVSLILLVPTLTALLKLLSNPPSTLSLLATGFSLFWIVTELIGHLSQTAPLQSLGLLHSDPGTKDMALAIYSVLREFSEALSLTSTFFCVITCLCFGLALIANKNRLSGYVFLAPIVPFPLELAIPDVGIQIHTILRGLALLHISSLLIRTGRRREF